jgi:hypothetical protein
VLRYHGRYRKYHRERLIDIIRGICPICATTHALIPSFSLPDSSHDTDDVERYLAGRAAGLSRREAGAHFLAAGREFRLLKRIERSFERCIRNWSAVFEMNIPMRHAFTTLAATVGNEGEPGILLEANRYALGRRVNAVFNSRASILLFIDRKAGKRIPHNLDSPQPSRQAPNSS